MNAIERDPSIGPEIVNLAWEAAEAKTRLEFSVGAFLDPEKVLSLKQQLDTMGDF